MEESLQPQLQAMRTSGFLLEFGSHSSTTVERPHPNEDIESDVLTTAIFPQVCKSRADMPQHTEERRSPAPELGHNYTTVIAPVAENLALSQIPRQTPPITNNDELIRPLVPKVYAPDKTSPDSKAARKFHRVSIDSWYFTKTIGTGSMGKVKLAKNRDRPDDICAVKVVTRALKAFLISEQHVAPPRTRVAARRRAKRLQKEIVRDKRVIREAALGKLCNHVNICSLLDFRTLLNHFYLFFEYIDGGQLLDYIVRGTRLRETQIRKFSRSILNALNYLHMNNIVHRDLKIENIMIAKDGTLKLIDFGLSNFYYKQEWGDNVGRVSRSVDNRDVAPLLKTFCGSLYFAAPELLNAKPYIGPEIDVWSFGVVLYVLACSRVPFDDENSAVLHQKIKSGRVSYPRKISPGIKDILTKIFVVNSRRRIGLKEIMEHPWMTKGYENIPIKTGLPLRLPLLEQNIDMSVINEMINLDLVSGEPNEVRGKLISIINEREYLQLSRSQWHQINNFCKKSEEADNKIQETYFESSTTAYHPLLSQYYLVKEYLMRKYSGTEKLNLSDPGFCGIFRRRTGSLDKNDNTATITAGGSSPKSNEAVNLGPRSDGNYQQNRSGIFSRNIFSKFMKYSSPHVSPTRKTHFNPSTETICSTIRDSATSGEQSSQSDIGKFLRKFSLVPDNSHKNGNGNRMNNIGPNGFGNMGTRHTRAVSDLTAEDYLPGLSQHTEISDSNNNEYPRITEMANQNNNPDATSVGNAPANTMLSIEYPHLIFLNGFFSSQTTTTRPLPVVRHKIIEALKSLNASYVEIKGGFICSVDYDDLESNNLVTGPKSSGHNGPHTATGTNDSHEETKLTLHDWEQPLVKRNSNKNRDEARKIVSVKDDNDTADTSNFVQPLSDRVFHPPRDNSTSDLLKKDLIVFEINLVKIKLVGLSGVRLKKHVGDPSHYKDFVSKFLKMLDL